jgi:TolB-like protein
MKRCPQCNLATDEPVSFCRVDGVRLEDSASGHDSKTVALLPDGSVVPSAMDESLIAQDKSLNVQGAATTVMDSSRAMSPTAYPFGGRRRRIGMAAISVIVALTLWGWVYHSLSRKKNAVIDSLAVLPFININADQQLEYLSDGMTETLIYDLSQLPKLNVKARSSVFRYKGKDVPPHTVGADLNVQAVLNGRIGLLGDMLTLNLELADAQTENVIWSEQYNSKQTDLVSLQSEIARDVSNKLRARLSGADVQMVSKTYTASAEAYQLYLKGRFHWNKRTAKDLEKAIEYFSQAITPSSLIQTTRLLITGMA